MKKKEAMISVIIPVYNVYAYLIECIDSVINQTYMNLEIIMIDDGSNDGSSELCDKIAFKDDRIMVIHKENGGLSDARNVGISKANGEFLFFLDSDDILDKNAIKCMVDFCDDNDVDIVIGQLQRFVDELTINNKKETVQFQTVDSNTALKKMLLHQDIGHEACGKLYKRKLWEKRKFPKGQLYEDYLVMYDLIMECENVGIIRKPLYYYRVRHGSIMNTKIERKELQILEVTEMVTNDIIQKRPEVGEYALYLQLVTCLKTMKRILDVGMDAYEDEQKKILTFVHKNKFLMMKRWVNIKDKIKIFCLMLNKNIFYYIYSMGERTNEINMK